MFVNLIEMGGKHAPQAVATAELTRGAALEDGAFIASVPKNYDGVNAIHDPKWVESDVIKQGERYNKVPTFVGERYATTEVTPAGLTDGALLTVSAGKWVKATSGTAEWKYGGEYPNPYGVTMYIIEKIKAATVA